MERTCASAEAKPRLARRTDKAAEGCPGSARETEGDDEPKKPVGRG